MTNDEQLIRQVIADWIQASEAGDTAAVLSLMAEDVIFLLPGQEPIKGRDAFASMSRQMEGKIRIKGKSEVQEITVFGDHASCWNHLTITVTPADGGPEVTRSGNILSIFRKEADGRWLLWRDANLLA